MARNKSTTSNATADPAVADQTSSSQIAEVPTSETDREDGTGDALPLEGAPDQAAGEAPPSTGGDQTVPEDGAAQGASGVTSEFAETVAATAIALRDALTDLSGSAQPSPSPAPQGSDLVSTDEQGQSAGAIEDETAFEGSSVLPAVIQLPLDVEIKLGELVVLAARDRDLDAVTWNAADPVTRDRWLSSAIVDLAYDIRTPHHVGEALVVEAVSRDDQPYHRCGVLWTAEPQEVLVHPLVVARLRADPFILVKAERSAGQWD